MPTGRPFVACEHDENRLGARLFRARSRTRGAARPHGLVFPRNSRKFGHFAVPRRGAVSLHVANSLLKHRTRSHEILCTEFGGWGIVCPAWWWRTLQGAD